MLSLGTIGLFVEQLIENTIVATRIHLMHVVTANGKLYTYGHLHSNLWKPPRAVTLPGFAASGYCCY